MIICNSVSLFNNSIGSFSWLFHVLQISIIVNDVLRDNSNGPIAVTTDADLKKKTKKRVTSAKHKAQVTQPANTPDKEAGSQKVQKSKSGTPTSLPADDSIIGKPCPICGTGTIIKGKTAYGCSNWKSGCTFRLPFPNQEG